MRPEDITELLRARPFVSLRIHMSDGQSYDIRHPEMVMVLRSRLVIGIGADSATGVLERLEHCALVHVVRIEQLQSVSPPTNGSSS